MEKAHVDKMREIIDKCGENASYFNLISENGFMSFTDNDSTKAIFTDEVIYFFRTADNNSLKSEFPMTVTAMEYDTFKQAKVQLTYEGFVTFLQELGASPSDDEWKEFIKQNKIREISNAKGFRVDVTVDDNGTTTVQKLDLDGKPITTQTIPYIIPGIQEK